VLSSLSGPLQVVPDIEDKYIHDNKNDSDESSAVLLSDIPPMDRDGQTTTAITELAHAVTSSDSDGQTRENKEKTTKTLSFFS
jgi:hypothetical protein